MSLYNMILGHDPMTPVLLTILRLRPEQIPRFRDCWWNGEYIVLLTRTGGGNRSEYEFENHALTQWPNYVRNMDSAMDSTYAEFYFRMPDNMQWVVPQLTVQPKTMDERLEETLAAMRDPSKTNDPKIRRANQAVQALMQQIIDALNKEQ